MPDDKVTLNAAGGSYRGRFISVETVQEPVTFDLSPGKLAGPIAQAMAEAIKQAIADLPQRAAAVTMRVRKNKGIVGDRLFQASGKLVESIVARLAGDSADVAVSGDRLGRDPRIMERLRAVVPLLRDPSALMRHPQVVKAREAAVRAMVQVTKRAL